MVTSAGTLVEIKSETDYKDDRQNKLKMIYAIHCTKTNECDVTISTHGGSNIVFPPNSFIQGAIYYIYIKKMTFDETKASFIGYRLLN